MSRRKIYTPLKLYTYEIIRLGEVLNIYIYVSISILMYNESEDDIIENTFYT